MSELTELEIDERIAEIEYKEALGAGKNAFILAPLNTAWVFASSKRRQASKK